MSDYSQFFLTHAARMQQAALFVPRPDPTYGNPEFAKAALRVLVVRLSPFRDVCSSVSHLFLFDAVRRVEPRAYIDFAFFPPKHDRRLLLESGIPLLVGIQSWRSAEDFDLVLVSNSFVLEMLNLPFVLRHSGWPLWAKERAGKFPPLILGGSNARAARCLAPFVDGLFVGEGEEVLAEIVRRRAVPDGGAVKVRRPRAALLPLRYPILNSPEAGTARLQITYGCPYGCSFCFEGFDRKPYRELPAEELLQHARLLKQHTGCEEVELLSFNFNTHTDIARLILELNRLFDRVRFQSQRVDVLARTPWLLPLEIAADKRSFTLGVEGVSERLRSWLNKSLSTADIRNVLRSLLRERIREIKLFYLLTGYETEQDVAEFGDFVRWLKETRAGCNPGLRVLFSFGFLVRMPGTLLEADRLFLEETDFKPILGPIQAACETNGFEFRLAMPWTEYVATQLLALGDESLSRHLAESNLCYDAELPPPAREQVKTWPRPAARRPRAVRPVGAVARPLRPPSDTASFCELMARKARLRPVYVRWRIPPEWSGAGAESLNARMMARLLQENPHWTDNLLSVREALFAPRGWQVTGETIFAVRAWDVAALGLETVARPAFQEATIELRQSGIGALVQEWLRRERLAFIARRDGAGYRLEMTAAARKKRTVFEAYVENHYARLIIGPKCRFDFRQVSVVALVV